MLRVTTFSVACLVLLDNVIARDLELPHSVLGRRDQCQARGQEYVGACIAQNLANDNGMECRHLICAAVAHVPRSWTPGSKVPVEYEGRLTGPPVDGTECAAGKVCRRGKCIFVDRIPMQVGPGAEFPCQSPAYRALVRYPQAETTPRSPAHRPAATRKSVIVSPQKRRYDGQH